MPETHRQTSSGALIFKPTIAEQEHKNAMESIKKERAELEREIASVKAIKDELSKELADIRNLKDELSK